MQPRVLQELPDAKNTVVIKEELPDAKNLVKQELPQAQTLEQLPDAKDLVVIKEELPKPEITHQHGVKRVKEEVSDEGPMLKRMRTLAL
jgi:hypothetical protein